MNRRSFLAVFSTVAAMAPAYAATQPAPEVDIPTDADGFVEWGPMDYGRGYHVKYKVIGYELDGRAFAGVVVVTGREQLLCSPDELTWLWERRGQSSRDAIRTFAEYKCRGTPIPEARYHCNPIEFTSGCEQLDFTVRDPDGYRKEPPDRYNTQ